MSEGEGPGSGPQPVSNRANLVCQLEFTAFGMDIADGAARVMVARGNGWKVTQYTDAEPATGAWRDALDTARWICLRRAA